MNSFEFETDEQSRAFCEQIATKMMELFQIPHEEAIGRINREWSGLKLIGQDDVIYHEDETYWANTIYYGKSSNWWLNPAGLKPKAY